MADFNLRYCTTCKEPVNALQDGREIILRCSCEWERALYERLKSTVAPQFWKYQTKTITDWSPPKFKKGGPGRFKNLIKVQKALTILKIYDYCFKVLGTDPSNQFKQYALFKSIDTGRNLFIRGPKGSGRDLLMSSIKMFAAGKDISATPLPADWSAFKMEISQSDWNGSQSEIAKTNITEQYKTPLILTLASVRGEALNKKFRSAGAIDDLFTKRLLHPGCMIFTSNQFSREIGDTVGDKLPEILNSDNTLLILLFSSQEADALLTALTKRIYLLREKIIGANAELLAAKKKLSDQFDQDTILEKLDEVLFLESAFPNFDGSKGYNESLTLLIATDFNKFHQAIRQKHTQFLTNKKENNLAYQEGLKKAYVAAVRDCPEVSSKMDDKEMIETGKMMNIACSGVERIKTLIDKAKELREKIVHD